MAAAHPSSPSSTGPAGALFEGRVGAHYLLSMLACGEPRGLPGTQIEQIRLQGAGDGFPLDDVIVHTHDTRGTPATLEIQVKRTVSFSPSDPIFRKVVHQIADTARRPDFWSARAELAIAIAQTSAKIDGAYQEVLARARAIRSPAAFMSSITRAGTTNEDMRTFVATFQANLVAAGVPTDDVTTWGLLSRMQILPFDFSMEGSGYEEFAIDRAARMLAPHAISQAHSLWSELIHLALDVASKAGSISRHDLRQYLIGKSFPLAGERHFAQTRLRLSEAARFALSDIGDTVADTVLLRPQRIAQINAARDAGRYIEIRGEAGVGKSALLKNFAEQVSAESQCIVLSHTRCTPRGWASMCSDLRFDGTARDLLVDLASSGGAMIFIDGLDSFDDPEQKTVIDLINEAATVRGVTVLATARTDFGIDDPSWLPSKALNKLGRAPPVVVDELTDGEVQELRCAAPQLEEILADNHPARPVARNLFRLSRLANKLQSVAAVCEADLAEQWWQSADGKHDDAHRDRARTLRFVAEHALRGIDIVDVRTQPSSSVDALIASGTLRDLRNDRIAFRHDVLREWAVANLVHADAQRITEIPSDRSLTLTLTRGVEVAAQLALRGATSAQGWQTLLTQVNQHIHHDRLRRAVLLASVHSGPALDPLILVSHLLVAEEGQLLRELVRVVMAVDVESFGSVLARAGVVDPRAFSGVDFKVPANPSWSRLILWTLVTNASLPTTSFPEIAQMYGLCCVGTLGRSEYIPPILACLHNWLTTIEQRRDLDDLREVPPLFDGKIRGRALEEFESSIRFTFLSFCDHTPELAAAYLRSLLGRDYHDRSIQSIMESHGALTKAAPKELAELISVTLIAPPASEERHERDPYKRPFTHLDHLFSPASPAQGHFLVFW